MTTTIYLAGPVAHAPRGGAGWRETIIERYEGGEYEFLNPLEKYNVPLEALDVVADPDPADPETVGVRELVERDKGLIRDADGVLVGYSPRRSIGTPMEVMFAFDRDIPTALWLRDDTDIEALSPWYRYHTDYVAGDVGACLARLHHLVHVAPEVGDE
jgi:nucleoside 2-deoxyribosyltransferase